MLDKATTFSNSQAELTLLHDSILLVWAIRALSKLARDSLTEDQYGNVQTTLPAITENFLNLLFALERKGIKTSHPKLKREISKLTKVVETSINQIVFTFGRSLFELNLSPETSHSLRAYFPSKH
jgi:nucleoporin NDC1